VPLAHHGLAPRVSDRTTSSRRPRSTGGDPFGLKPSFSPYRSRGLNPTARLKLTRMGGCQVEALATTWPLVIEINYHNGENLYTVVWAYF
jgi:hypothetical protein